MSNDAAGDRLGDVLARLHGQLADIAAMQKKQAALTLSAAVADGSVEVTVNAQGQVVKTIIDESFLDDHDFDDLGDYVTEAAQNAARNARERVAAMLAPITERQRSFPSFSEIVEGLPDPGDLIPPGLDVLRAAVPRREGWSASAAGASSNDGDGGAGFPVVRR